MNNMELRLAGSGGQGVILATVILAEAAVLAGKHTAQSQAYGPEARGGSCKAEVLISDRPIGFTKVRRPTFLMALTQASLDTYAKNLPADCLVLMDDTLTPPAGLDPKHTVRLPILHTAKEKVGKALTANIVAVGCINGLLHLVSPEVLEQAVLMHIPRGTETLNRAALHAGTALVAGPDRAPAKAKAAPVPAAKKEA